MAEEQLKPEVKDPEVVYERLQHYKNLQKKSYDHVARNLPVLNQGDVVRIQGEKRFPQRGVVEGKSKHPRSYLVKSSSGTYRRNRRHLLKVERNQLKNLKLRIWVRIENDHKPLEAIARKPLHDAPKRIQGMLLNIQKYDTVFSYKPGPQMYLADTLSRAFLTSSANTQGEFERSQRTQSHFTFQRETKTDQKRYRAR